MTAHRQTIESAWDSLLEAVAEAQQDASKQTPALPELAARDLSRGRSLVAELQSI